MLFGKEEMRDLGIAVKNGGEDGGEDGGAGGDGGEGICGSCSAGS